MNDDDEVVLDYSAEADQALVFGVKCPYCEKSHLFSALGVEVQNEEGEAVGYEPTLNLVDVDDEGDVVQVRCLTCWEIFGLICIVKVFNDPAEITYH